MSPLASPAELRLARLRFHLASLERAYQRIAARRDACETPEHLGRLALLEEHIVTATALADEAARSVAEENVPAATDHRVGESPA